MEGRIHVASVAVSALVRDTRMQPWRLEASAARGVSRLVPLVSISRLSDRTPKTTCGILQLQVRVIVSRLLPFTLHVRSLSVFVVRFVLQGDGG